MLRTTEPDVIAVEDWMLKNCFTVYLWYRLG